MRGGTAAGINEWYFRVQRFMGCTIFSPILLACLRLIPLETQITLRLLSVIHGL